MKNSESSGNIKLQIHKHSMTCYKKITSNNAKKCRFDAPLLPSQETFILTPTKDNENGFVNYRNKYSEMKIKLENKFLHFFLKNVNHVKSGIIKCS